MGKKVYTATALTGGSSGALDAINGSLLVDGDLAIVTYGGRAYLYELDHDNSSAEASPYIILPDKSYGTKRWILQPFGDGYYSLASVYRATDQTGLVDESWTKISLDTEFFDIGGNFASNKYTVPAGGDGYYLLTWGALFYTSAGGAHLIHAQTQIYLDGVATGRRGSIFIGGPDTYSLSAGSCIINLAAANYIELYAVGATDDASTTTLVGGGYTRLDVCLLSR